jgi:hypothetical protein
MAGDGRRREANGKRFGRGRESGSVAATLTARGASTRNAKPDLPCDSFAVALAAAETLTKQGTRIPDFLPTKHTKGHESRTTEFLTTNEH